MHACHACRDIVHLDSLSYGLVVRVYYTGKQVRMNPWSTESQEHRVARGVIGCVSVQQRQAQVDMS